MSSIKLRYKKDKKVFVPDKDIDLPDNFEIDIPENIVEKQINQSNDKSRQLIIKEKFVEYYLQKYPDRSINDIDKNLLELIGINAEYSENSSYKDDKKRVSEYLSEKYSG